MPSANAPGPPELFSPPVIDADPDAPPGRGPHDDLAGHLLNAVSRARWFAGKGRLAELTGHAKLGWLTELDEWPAVRIEIVEISYPPDEDPDDMRAEPAMRAEPFDKLRRTPVEALERALRPFDKLRAGRAQGASAEHAQGASAEHAQGASDTRAEPFDPSTSSGQAELRRTPVEAQETPYELYQLVVSYRQAPKPDLAHAELARTTDPDLGRVVAYDGAQDPAACQILLRRLLDGRRVREPDSEVRFAPSDTEGLSGMEEPQPFRGQQSNTSVMFGEVAMLKLFRRLELGRNLDIETHDALNTAGVRDVARLYGWIEASWRHRGADVHADLAMLVEKLTGAEDGWQLAIDALAAGRSFADEAAKLGSALAEIHHALRAAFPTDRIPGAAAAEAMAERFEVARAIAPALDAYTDGIRAGFSTLASADLDVQRVHGDFHLGQTLRTPDGWKMIDFEGEPAKTLTERLAPDSIWRDIAGMLRSFDYAAASVPGPEAAAWVADCRTAFLGAYADGTLTAVDAAILRAYEVDKAVYEVIYEFRNRPDWVHIPLGAVAALSGAAPEHDQTASGAKPTTDQTTHRV